MPDALLLQIWQWVCSLQKAYCLVLPACLASFLLPFSPSCSLEASSRWCHLALLSTYRQYPWIQMAVDTINRQLLLLTKPTQHTTSKWNIQILCRITVFPSSVCVCLGAVSSLHSSQPTVFLLVRSFQFLLSFLFFCSILLISLFAGMLFSPQFHWLWWSPSRSTPMGMVPNQGKQPCSEEKWMHAHLLSGLIKLLLWG